MGEVRQPIVVAIDGPAGSGKSTVAAKLAKKLGFVHLNSGLLFRSLAREAQQQSIALDNDQRLAELARSLEFRYELAPTEGTTRFLVNGVELGNELSSTTAGELASRVAVLPAVREVFASLQQEISKRQSLVVEGRDAGTIVFPDTPFKFYLDASVEVRAQRRYRELAQSGSQQSFAEVLTVMQQRDKRDSTRSVAPQVKATDATLIDTTLMTVDEVVEKLYSLIKPS